MLYFKLATVYRAPGLAFPLRTLRREMIGTMILNASLGRHEMELDEPTYLKFAKDLTLLAAMPQCAVFVVGVRDESPTLSRAHPVEEFQAGYNLAMDGKDLPDDASLAAKAGCYFGLIEAHPDLADAPLVAQPIAEPATADA